MKGWLPVWALALGLVVCLSHTDSVTGPGSGPAEAGLHPVDDSVFAFVDVNVVPMDAPGVVSHQTVIVRRGRIEAVGAASDTPVPGGATRVDAAGRYLLPGLVDMHVHLSREALPAYLSAGVTTVRNMWGYPEIMAMQREVADGSLLGPTIFSTSPGLDGTPAKWPYTQIVMDPAKADSVVAAQARGGWTTLKLYTDLRPEVYDSIVASARRRGLEYLGHVPRRISVEHLLRSGQRSLEHLGGYQFITDPARLDSLYALTVSTGESMIAEHMCARSGPERG